MSDLTCLMPERGSCIYLFGWEQNNDAKDCSTEQDPLLSLRKALSLFCTSTCQWENTNRCCPSQRWTKATMKDKSKTERQHLSPSHRGEEGGASNACGLWHTVLYYHWILDERWYVMRWHEMITWAANKNFKSTKISVATRSSCPFLHVGLL